MILPYCEPYKIKTVETIRQSTRQEREEWIRNASYNLFNLRSEQVFIDLLTDSGTGAMSDKQWGAIMTGDESYAGASSYYTLKETIRDITGFEHFLPTHQGRAAENVLFSVLIKEGDVIPGNAHFDTTKGHIEFRKAKAVDYSVAYARDIRVVDPFKGNADLERLEQVLKETPREKLGCIVMTVTNNTAGGQPVSMANLRGVRELADRYGVLVVMDSARFAENAYFIKTREEAYKNKSIHEVLTGMCDLCDIVYFSGRKVSSSRGGGICTNDPALYNKMKDLVPLYEGFLTYGGISIREIEAMATGLLETKDEDVVGQSPSFINYAVKELDKLGLPVIMPGGALGCHVEAQKFIPHVPQSEYPAGALVAAFFIVSGIRGMERGTLSSIRDEKGNDIYAYLELMRLAFPRRVFTLSQVEYIIDRLNWLFHNSNLIGGLRFVEEPPVLRFFTGRLEPIGNWPEKLMAKFREDFGDSL